MPTDDVLKLRRADKFRYRLAPVISGSLGDALVRPDEEGYPSLLR